MEAAVWRRLPQQSAWFWLRTALGFIWTSWNEEAAPHPASSLGRTLPACSHRWSGLSADVSLQRSAADAGTTLRSASPGPVDDQSAAINIFSNCVIWNYVIFAFKLIKSTSPAQSDQSGGSPGPERAHSRLRCVAGRFPHTPYLESEQRSGIRRSWPSPRFKWKHCHVSLSSTSVLLINHILFFSFSRFFGGKIWFP